MGFIIVIDAAIPPATTRDVAEILIPRFNLLKYL